MQKHPNAIIVHICYKAGIQLKKGQAAKIQAEVPDLDPERVLEAARKIDGTVRPIPQGGPKNTKKRIRSLVRKRIDQFFILNPDLATHRVRLTSAAVADLVARFPSPDALIPEVGLSAAIDAAADPIRQEASMGAWFADRDVARLILRELFTPDLWRDHAGQDEGLEQALLERTRRALFMTGAKEVKDPGDLITALVTPVPIEGPDPNHRERRVWDRVWTVILPAVERACGPEKGPYQTSLVNRTLLLARMFPGLGGDGTETDRVATLDAQIRAREAETAERKQAEARAEKDRRAYEARLVRRDELETLLPATKAETLRWTGDGRIPVAMRRSFRKWGKDLEVTMHDPDLVPEWRAKLSGWRASDAEERAAAARGGRALAARQARIRNLLEAALPEGAGPVSLQPSSKDLTSLSVTLFAPLPLCLEGPEGHLTLRVPIRVALTPDLWSPVAEGRLTGRARTAAIEAIRDGVNALLADFLERAKPGLSSLHEELAPLVSSLPGEVLITFRDTLERNLRGQKNSVADPSRVGPFLRDPALRTLKRAEGLHQDLVLARASGLADYPSLFPQARLMRRQVHLHLGPTNSGKTHAAIERLKAAPTGLYAAPLRLMAMEWADRLNGDGVPTDLVTGEEVIRVEGARHLSVTIEMSPLRTPIEVAVIDEAQLIADEERGWAWTQAILGLPARELHLTGSPDAEPWVRLLTGMTGDDLTVHRYERLVPLERDPEPVRFNEVRPGDAIIAFSRARVLQIRDEIRSTGRQVATVYGALSPEVRREEARRFRDGKAGVLVATDAIGMGLNLPVSRVLLSEGEKFDGVERRPLNGAEIRQIVGRAGRFGLSDAEVGLAGVYTGTAPGMGARIQDQIARALRERPEMPDLIRPRVKPGGEVVELIGELMGTDRLYLILRKAHENILSRDPVFRSGISSDMLLLAGRMDTLSLSLRDRYGYVCAPVDARDEAASGRLFWWARTHLSGAQVPYDLDPASSPGTVRTEADLAALEGQVKLAGLYLWCAHRWPNVFTQGDAALEGRSALNAAVTAALRGKRLKRICRSCGETLPRGHAYAICDYCHIPRVEDWDSDRD